MGFKLFRGFLYILVPFVLLVGMAAPFLYCSYHYFLCLYFVLIHKKKRKKKRKKKKEKKNKAPYGRLIAAKVSPISKYSPFGKVSLEVPQRERCVMMTQGHCSYS